MPTNPESKADKKRSLDRARLHALRRQAVNRVIAVTLWLTPEQRTELRSFLTQNGWQVHSARAALAALGVLPPSNRGRVVAPAMPVDADAPTHPVKRRPRDKSQAPAIIIDPRQTSFGFGGGQ